MVAFKLFVTVHCCYCDWLLSYDDVVEFRIPETTISLAIHPLPRAS